LGLTNALAGPPNGTSGSVADREVARRQKLVDDAKLSILEADELALDAKMAEALELYYQAYSTTSEAELSRLVHLLARRRIATISVVHATQLASIARYEEANKVLDRMLAPGVSPGYKPGVKLKTEIADPEHYNPALTPEHLEKVRKVENLFHLAEGHMKLGNWDMASLTYASILREDPTNEAARRSMEAATKHISDYHDTARGHFRAKALSAVDAAWESQIPLRGDAVDLLKTLPTAGLSDPIVSKLRDIIIPEVDFTSETLDEVAFYLTRRSKELDPTGVGINFVVNISPDDIATQNVTVNLKLNGIPLGDLVRFITEQTGTKFYIDQFAVVIVSKNANSERLVMKTFSVPPDLLSSNPEDDEAGGDDIFGGGGERPSGIRVVKLTARKFLEKKGVTFPEGASAIHSPATNQLTVHNTQANIDLVDAMVSNMRKGGDRTVLIELTQVEINNVHAKDMTFDVLMGQFNLPGSSGTFGSAAGNITQTGLEGENDANYAFTPPGGGLPVGQRSLTGGLRSGLEAIPGNAIDSVASGARAGSIVATQPSQKSPGPLSVSGPFTDPQFQVALRSINQLKDTTIANQPAVLTTQGLRSLIEVHRAFIYPTEYDPPEIPQTFNQGGGGGVIFNPATGLFTFIPGADPPNTFPVTPAHPTAFDVRNVGTRFEVEPIIDPNGFYVTLNMTVDFSQFEGFINYGTPITNGTTVLTDNRILQPLFKSSRFTTPVTVQDGSSFVIGGLVNEEHEFTNDKVPFLAEVPVLGRMFKGKVSERRRKAILFFVKVRILDPSGQPINRFSDDG